MKRLFQFAISKPLLVNLLSIFICLAGILSIKNINRDAFPPINFNVVLINTTYSGAGPHEIEKLITIPLERELKTVSDIKKMSSSSIEGMSIIAIEIEQAVTDIQPILNDIQRAVDRTTDLPTDLRNPPNIIEIKSETQPIIEVSLSGKMSELELTKLAKQLEDRILDLPDVAAITRRGWRDREVLVELNPDLLEEHWISLSEIAHQLEKTNQNIPGGRVKVSGKEFLIRTSGEFKNGEDVANTYLRTNEEGDSLQIKDIAKITDDFKETAILYRTNSTKSINLVVIKKKKGDAIRMVEEVKQTVNDFQKISPSTLNISFVNDFSFYVKRRLKVLITNGSIGFILIIIALFLFLNPRIAIVTAIGIPIALFATFFVMYSFGITLNLIAMFGMITVLGMLVDDAVVVAENTFRYIEEGVSHREAALKGISGVWKPVTTSVLTTMAAFSPLMFMSGVMGKFVFQIPLIVIIALLASLLEVYFVLPSHISEMNRIPILFSKRKNKQRGHHLMEIVTNHYEKWIRYLLSKRYWVLLATFFILSGGVLISKLVPNILFPSKGIEIFFIRAETKLGAPLEETAMRFELIEKLLQELPEHEVDNYALHVGIQQNDPGDPFTERFSHIGQIAVYLSPEANRNRDAQQIIESLRTKTLNIEGFERIRFEMMKGGPPVGKPIEIKVKGESLELLQKTSEEIISELKNLNGVTDIKNSSRKGKDELQIILSEQKAKQAQVSIQDVGLAIRAAFDGIVATTIKKTEEQIDVRVELASNTSDERELLKSIRVPNQKGGLVALTQIASFKEMPGLNIINHTDRKRSISITANVDESKTTSLDVNKKLTKQFGNWEKEYPGYQMEFGGEFENTTESLESLIMAFLLGALLIFIILATQFNSLWQPLVVMSAIPLGFVGVLLAFLIHNEPKSFLALLGAVGLAGVVVNNSIVLVDFINEARAKGIDKLESIVMAGRLRLRPVILTSITTVLGLVSLAYGFWGSDPFLQPMALVFVWGITFAMGLTLAITPCLHAIADDLITKINWLKFWK